MNFITTALNKLFKSDGYSGKLKPWDWRYYAEKKREKKFKFNEDDEIQFFKITQKIAFLAKIIKKKVFDLSKQKFPEAKIFGITTGKAVMRINFDLGYQPVSFSELSEFISSVWRCKQSWLLACLLFYFLFWLLFGFASFC